MIYAVIVEYYKGKDKGKRIIYDNVELKEILDTIDRIRIEHPKGADIFIKCGGSVMFAQDFIEGMYKYRMA